MDEKTLRKETGDILFLVGTIGIRAFFHRYRANQVGVTHQPLGTIGEILRIIELIDGATETETNNSAGEIKKNTE